MDCIVKVDENAIGPFIRGVSTLPGRFGRRFYLNRVINYAPHLISTRTKSLGNKINVLVFEINGKKGCQAKPAVLVIVEEELQLNSKCGKKGKKGE